MTGMTVARTGLPIGEGTRIGEDDFGPDCGALNGAMAAAPVLLRKVLRENVTALAASAA